MSSDDSLFQSFGGLSLPVTAADVINASFAAALDPATGILAGLFKAAINAELGDGWAALIASIGAGQLSGSVPVRDTLELEPTPAILQQRKHGWPVLFVYRGPEPIVVDEVGLAEDRITQKWGVDYILGPLDIGDERKLSAALIAAAKVIILTIRQGGHRAYQVESNGQASQVLGRDGCGFTDIKATDFRCGVARFSDADAPGYHAMSMVLTTTETTEFDESDVPMYLGTSVHAGQGNRDGILENFIDADSEQPSGAVT